MFVLPTSYCAHKCVKQEIAVHICLVFLFSKCTPAHASECCVFSLLGGWPASNTRVCATCTRMHARAYTGHYVWPVLYIDSDLGFSRIFIIMV